MYTGSFQEDNFTPFTGNVKGAFKALLCCVVFVIMLHICLRTSIFATPHSHPVKVTQLRYFKNNYCKWIFVLKL